jgi:hypothetical protein
MKCKKFYIRVSKVKKVSAVWCTGNIKDIAADYIDNKKRLLLLPYSK